MRKRIRDLGLAFFIASCSILPAFCQTSAPLPQPLKVELKRLEETWRILDLVAEKVWPGWTSYRDVPFRFHYPNGVEMLVGHPDPPDGYQLIPSVEVSGRKVYLDRRREIPLQLKSPLLGGGGVLPFGKNNRVETVDLQMSETTIQDLQTKAEKGREIPERLRLASENQILINVHELFHCFQRTVYQYRYGNLQMNPDLAYALYAEVEALALDKAFAAKDDAAARDYLKDFVVARSLKRKSMTIEERNQESEDELMEGTAVYAETRLLELLKSGYTPVLTQAEDPYFLGFRDLDYFLAQKVDRLKESGADSLDARGKCYSYGSFQSLLLSRLFPGWQAEFFQKKRLLSDDIEQALKLEDAEREGIAGRLEERYHVSEIKTRHAAAIGGRDAAYALIEGRKGRRFIINFKPLGEYLAPQGHGSVFTMGLIELYPDGIREVRVNDAVFQGQKVPMVKDQLFYLKWVDTDSKPDEKGYELTFSRMEGPGVYRDAEIKTRGFTLKAPKVRVSETPARVKITILSKLSGS